MNQYGLFDQQDGLGEASLPSEDHPLYPEQASLILPLSCGSDQFQAVLTIQQAPVKLPDPGVNERQADQGSSLDGIVANLDCFLQRTFQLRNTFCRKVGVNGQGLAKEVADPDAV